MRSVAVVITITGRLGIANVDAAAAQLARYTCLEAALILDVRGLDVDSGQLLPHLLSLFSAECHWGGVEWVLVADHADLCLDHLPPVEGHDTAEAASVVDALAFCTSAIRIRRSLPLFE